VNKVQEIERAKESVEKLRALCLLYQDPGDISAYWTLNIRPAFTDHYSLLDVLASNATKDQYSEHSDEILDIYANSRKLLDGITESSASNGKHRLIKSDLASAERKLAVYRGFMESYKQEQIPVKNENGSVGWIEYLSNLIKKPVDVETQDRTRTKLEQMESDMSRISSGSITLTDLESFYEKYDDLDKGIKSGKYKDGKTRAKASNMLEQIFSRYDHEFRKQIIEYKSTSSLPETDRENIRTESILLSKWLHRENALGTSRRARISTYVSELDYLLDRRQEEKSEELQPKIEIDTRSHSQKPAGIGKYLIGFLAGVTILASTTMMSVNKENKYTPTKSNQSITRKYDGPRKQNYFKGEGLEYLRAYFKDPSIKFNPKSGLPDKTELKLLDDLGMLEKPKEKWWNSFNRVKTKYNKSQQAKLKDAFAKSDQIFGKVPTQKALEKDPFLHGSSKFDLLKTLGYRR